MSWDHYRPYVSVAERRAEGRREMEKRRKKGLDVQPVEIEGRIIAKTFWGKAWCDHLESFSDYENRLPRGQRYAKNGSVCHLGIDKGKIEAFVSGSEIYKVKVEIKTLPATNWSALKRKCSGSIGSLIELIQGRLSESVMATVTDRDTGLFPSPDEISFNCDCPDWATMCKHVAAVLYGIGARLDQHPEMLFHLRGVDHEELVDADVGIADATGGGGKNRIGEDALADVFGIDLSDDEEEEEEAKPPARKKTAKRTVAGEDVAKMRKKFGMSQREFGILVGVSIPTVGKWEKTTGALNLREENLKTLREAKRLSRKKAWKRFDEKFRDSTGSRH